MGHSRENDLVYCTSNKNVNKKLLYISAINNQSMHMSWSEALLLFFQDILVIECQSWRSLTWESWSVTSGFLGGASGKKKPACQCRRHKGMRVQSLGQEDPLILGLGRSPGDGNGNSRRYSSLENPMDRGAWQSTVYGVTQSWIWLK